MKAYNMTFTNLYRVGIVGVMIYIHYNAYNKIGEAISMSSLMFYLLLILYGITFSMLNVNKKISYVELLSVFGLIYFFEHNILYALIVLPIVSIIGTKAKKYDLIIFAGLFIAFFYSSGFSVAISIFIGFALYIIMEIFHSKFNQLEVLQNELYKSKKELEKKELELGDKNREIEITSNMFVHSKYLSETIEVEELMQLIVDSAKSFFNAEYACLYTKKEDGFYIEKEAGESRRHKVPEKLNFSDADEIRIENKMLRVTIDYEGAAWGVISVYGKKAKVGDTNQYVHFPFVEEDFEVLSVYLKMAMSPIKHANLLKTMNYLANNDFLTGIPNRRHLIEKFDYLSKIASRGQHLSVLILDIDHFKHVNDEFGHDAGDEVLKEVAETIKYTIREIDVVGRLGGEEFAVLLLGSDGNAQMVAERIRNRIQKIPFKKQITVSIGIAEFGEDGNTWKELNKKADVALYHAKENGRNQVVKYNRYLKNDES